MNRERANNYLYEVLQNPQQVSNAGAYEVITSYAPAILTRPQYLPVEDSMVLHIDNIFCSFSV